MGDETWIIRAPDKQFNLAEDVNANNSNLFTLEFHHGGELTTFPKVCYQRGGVTYVDKVKTCHFSMNILNDIVLSLGYDLDDLDYLRYHFRVPGEDMDFGLRALGTDFDVNRLIKHAIVTKVIEVYVERVQKYPSFVPCSDLGVFVQDHNAAVVYNADDEGSYDGSYEGSDEEDVDKIDQDSIVGIIEGDDDGNDPDFIVDEENLVEDYEVDMDEFRAVVDYDAENLVEDNVIEENLGDVQVDLDDFDSLSDPDDDTKLQKAVRSIRRTKNKVKETSDCPFYVGQSFRDREAIKETVKKHAVESRRQLFITKNDTKRFRVVCRGINPKLGSCDSNVGLNMVGGICGNSSNKGGGCDSAKTRESGESHKEPKKKIPPPTCPWVLHISNHQKSVDTWVVKTLQKEHQCLQTRDVGLCTISWLTKEVELIVRVNPNISLLVLQDQLQKKLQVQITTNQLVRARKFAIDKVQGDYRAQYGLLRDYGEELLRSNPGTTVKIDIEPACNPSSPTRQFRRIYICFGGLKNGFNLIGREILGLDGCFMKGPFPGQILSAVGVDGNNGIYPLAYALVEAETKSSWSWFLECLGDDLNLPSNGNFTFISDRQKGIMPAIAKVFPNAEHRYCIRHIHENMKQKWRGQKFKNLFWNCASATWTPWFDHAMKAVLEEDKDLHAWLKEIPPRHWTRSQFSGRAKCDMLLNNICEVFNRQLIYARDKPVITCLEYIREYLMKRFVVVHKLIAKSQGPLSPYATETLDKIKQEASDYTVIFNCINKYQVTGPWGDQKIVRLDLRTCSCRKWDLTGLPCKHAVACIWNLALHGKDDGVIEKWVDKCYWLETWKEVYSHTIDPVNGQDLWTPSACPTKLTAPKHHKQVGRPKKKRKKSAVEVSELSEKMAANGKMSRKGDTVTCDKCGHRGHNRRTCKGQPPQDGVGHE